MAKRRRKFTSQEKAAIIREHLIDKVSVSDICDRHNLQPTVFYRWQKTAFENLPALFESTGKSEAQALRAQMDSLKEKLAHKDTVIGEIMEDYVAAKKKIGES